MKTELAAIVLFLLASLQSLAAFGSEPGDWPMAGRSPSRNPVVPDGKAPTDWDYETGSNIKWSAYLGSQTYGTPVVADGRVFVGTNNGEGYLERYPSNVDLGCLLCFREADGQFLWQFSAEKLPSGRVHDWPMQGIGCPPLVEGERMWFVSNRWEVVCLDTRGFHDSENDGPARNERITSQSEADVVWKLDLMAQLGVHPHPAGMGPDRRCSVATFGNNIYVITGNGVDEGHTKLPAPLAPSLVCLDKHSGKVIWTDNSPGGNILHTQVASPLVANIAGRPQVIVPMGDGWIRSFDAESGELFWKFDMNLKTMKWTLGGGRGTRNNILATPVLYEGRIYIANGQEMEHGEGLGRLVCLDPTKTGDISSELAVDRNGKAIPHRRYQAVNPQKGEKALANPNSGLIWEFITEGEEFEDQMHRSISSVAVHGGLVIAADGAGLVHCLSAKTGERYWAYDVLAAIWSAPLIVGETVYVPDEDGEVNIFRLSADPKRAMKHGESGLTFVRGKRQDLVPLREIAMNSPFHSSPVFANGTLYLATKNRLYAVAAKPSAKSANADVGSKPRGKEPASTKPVRKRDKPNENRVPKSAFVPTPRDVVVRMLELADVTSKDTVCDLGSGDGRILITAAQKYGAKAVGFEIDRPLVQQSKKDAAAAGVADRVTVHQTNLFNADVSAVSVLTLYLYPVQNRKLLPRLKKLRDGVRIVTHRYRLPGIRPDKALSLDSSESGETHKIFRYTTPLQSEDAADD